MEQREIITDRQLEKIFLQIDSVKGCNDFTNFIYTNSNKLDRELYQRAVIAVNDLREKIKSNEFKMELPIPKKL
jgi:hypothetical protein